MTSSAPDAPALNFSGHETFPLRYTWLPKGIQAKQNDTDIFQRDDAMATLGVGKNMVSAIRYWCRVLGLLDKDANDSVTEFGEAIFAESGYDPYLEDVGTLWLLHWHLTRHSSQATTWLLTFTQRSQDTFTRDQLLNWLDTYSQQQGKTISRNSLKRDVDVFTRTYVPSQPTRTRPLEETFDSPLVELGLIFEQDDPDQGGKGSVCYLPRREQTTLPIDMFVYALHDYWQGVAADQQTLSFDRLQYALGCPGGAFRLSDNAMTARLEQLPDWSKLRFDETAGMRQLYRDGTLDLANILARYYQTRNDAPTPALAF
jgi:hypothetical protein